MAIGRVINRVSFVILFDFTLLLLFFFLRLHLGRPAVERRSRRGFRRHTYDGGGQY